MKVEVMKDRSFLVKEVYQGFVMETAEGNRIAICMRDDTFEINVLPKDAAGSSWSRANMKTRRFEAHGDIQSPKSVVLSQSGSVSK